MRQRNRRIERILRGAAFAGLFLVTPFLSDGALRAQDTSTPPNPSVTGERTCTLATVHQRQERCSYRDSGAGVSLDNERLGTCEVECHACCDNFGGLNGWDRTVVDAMCNCLVEAGTTPGGLASCVDPLYLLDQLGLLAPGNAAISPEDALALLRFYDISSGIQDAMLESEEALQASEWMNSLPPELRAKVRVEVLRKSLSWLKLGGNLFNSVFDVCGHLEDWIDQEYRDWCHEDCRVLFKPTEIPVDGEPDPPAEPADPGDGPRGPSDRGPGGGDGDPFGPGSHGGLGEPCLGTSGQACTLWDGQGKAHWGKVNRYCDCEATWVDPDDFGLCPWCTWGVGGDIFWLIVQWY